MEMSYFVFKHHFWDLFFLLKHVQKSLPKLKRLMIKVKCAQVELQWAAKSPLKTRPKGRPRPLSYSRKWTLFLMMTWDSWLQSKPSWPPLRDQLFWQRVVSQADCENKCITCGLWISHHGILFCADSTFGAMFDGQFEEIHFKSPSVVIKQQFCSFHNYFSLWSVWFRNLYCFGLFQADVSSYVRLLCLAENLRTDSKDVSCLLEWNGCDIRQSLLQLQFWACSGEVQQIQRPLPSSGKDVFSLIVKTCFRNFLAVYDNMTICFRTIESKGKPKSGTDLQPVKAEDVKEENLPHCHTAFTESLLGVCNMQTENIADLLLKVSFFFSS